MFRCLLHPLPLFLSLFPSARPSSLPSCFLPSFFALSASRYFYVFRIIGRDTDWSQVLHQHSRRVGLSSAITVVFGSGIWREITLLSILAGANQFEASCVRPKREFDKGRLSAHVYTCRPTVVNVPLSKLN